jgi:hypothetical protein
MPFDHSWVNEDYADPAPSAAGQFLKLKDGDSVDLIIVGAPYHFWKAWDETSKPKQRFVVEVFRTDTEEPGPTQWMEVSGPTWGDILSALRTVMKKKKSRGRTAELTLSRTGSGATDTRYKANAMFADPEDVVAAEEAEEASTLEPKEEWIPCSSNASGKPPSASEDIPF